MRHDRDEQPQSLAAEFLAEIEKFLSDNGMTATAFGKAAVNDGHLVRNLRAGNGVTSRRIDRVREFMSEYRRDAA